MHAEKNMVAALGRMLAVFCTGYALCKYVNCSSITQLLPSYLFLDRFSLTVQISAYACVCTVLAKEMKEKKQTGNRMTEKKKISFCTNKTPQSRVCALRKFVVYFFSSLHSVLFD